MSDGGGGAAGGSWVWAWSVALLGLAVFIVSVRGDYVYDDVPVVLEDARVRDVGHFGQIWSRDYNFDVRTGEGSVDNLYRPLVTTSYFVQIGVLGSGTLGLRVVNLVLYGLVCGLVARLGMIQGGVGVGVVAGVVFAVHPVHAEVLATIVGRAELMVAAGLLGAVVLLLGRPLTYGRAVAIVGCGGVAVLSKEQGLLLPGLLLAAAPLRPRPAEGVRAGIRPGQVLVLGVCGLVAGYIVLREQVLGLKFWWDRGFLDVAVQPMIWSVGWDRWLMPLVLLGQAVLLLVVPWSPSLDYSGAVIGWTVGWTDVRLWVGAAAAVGLLAGGVWAVLARRWAWVWVLAGGVMTWGVVGNGVSLIGVNFADRLVFLPSVFFALGVGMAWPAGRLWRVGLGVWVVLLAGQSVRHAWMWSQPRMAVYAWSLERQPRSMRLHQLLADEQMKAGELDAAAATILRGAETMPTYFGVWIQAGVIAEKRERWEEAERYYAKAAEVDPQRGSGALLDFRARRGATSP